MIKKLESLIEDSKLIGVWSGYIRQEFGEDALNELLDSGHYVKVKKNNPLNADANRGGFSMGYR